VTVADALLAEFTDEQLRALAQRLIPLLRDANIDVLLSTAEAAARLGVHPKTLTRGARESRVPGARRVGHGWRFDPARLDLLPVSTSRVRPTTGSPARPRRTCRNDASSTAVAAIRGAGSAVPRRR
jgi:hypothetical protein